MGLGYDIEQDNRDFEKEGITGEVSKYSFDIKEYPNITIHMTEEQPLQKHKFEVLPKMFASSSIDVTKEKDNSVCVYVTDGIKLARAGKIAPRQVKALLRLLEDNKVDGWLNETTHLEGDYLYVLCD